MTDWLYLPLDVKVREIEAKTFLAAQAVMRGYKVVIGQKQKFPSITSCYPPGHYLGFSALQNFLPEYKKFQSQGHAIILMDEEGLVTHREEIYTRVRLNPETLNVCEIFAAWGDMQAAFVCEKRPEIARKVLSSGNPRLDILRPEKSRLFEEEAKKLRDKHGDFILFNSNFGSCNHFNGADKYLKSLAEKKVIQTEEEQTYYAAYFAYRRQVMDAILAALPGLSRAFPEHKIIIRPHPSENRQAWIDAATGLRNVEVIHEGSVIPWMQAARAVFHNYCTTAVEYFAMGGSPIAYRPVIDDKLESPLPTQISILCQTPEELYEKIRFILSGKPDPARAAKEELLGRRIKNLSGPYASDLILDRAAKTQIKKPSLRRSAGIAPLIHAGRKKLEWLKSLVVKSEAKAYVLHKFPELKEDEIRSLLRRLEPAPGHYDKIRIKKIHDNTFLLST